MLRKPHGELGCLVGKVIDFNAVEMIESDAGDGQFIELLQNLHLQPAQLLVRDDEEGKLEQEEKITVYRLFKAGKLKLVNDEEECTMEPCQYFDEYFYEES